MGWDMYKFLERSQTPNMYTRSDAALFSVCTKMLPPRQGAGSSQMRKPRKKRRVIG